MLKKEMLLGTISGKPTTWEGEVEFSIAESGPYRFLVFNSIETVTTTQGDTSVFSGMLIMAGEPWYIGLTTPDGTVDFMHSTWEMQFDGQIFQSTNQYEFTEAARAKALSDNPKTYVKFWNLD